MDGWIDGSEWTVKLRMDSLDWIDETSIEWNDEGWSGWLQWWALGHGRTLCLDRLNR